ncbi:MAG: elongation factor P [Hespellia sp.]|nr:elongation factor P [Hespellia sp.]
MATKSAGDFRNGMTLEIDGKVCQVIDFMHVKPGKGAAFVRVKLKDIMNGGVTETTFRPSESFEEAFIERKPMEYLYNDGDLYYFMDTESYEQIAVNADDVVDSMKFVKENESVSVSSYQGKVFAVEPPITVELVITETEPGFKGNTAQGATKPATVETGAQVNVPLFVDQGEKIKIDTRTGEYLSRAN